MEICYNIKDGLGNPLAYNYLYIYPNRDHFLSSEIKRFKNIEIILIEDGNLEELPEEIGELKKLKKLTVTGNKLKKLPDGLSNCKSLTILNLSNNRLESLPSWLGSFKNLETLAVFKNILKKIPDSIGDLKNLEQLFFHCNSLDTIPDSFANLRNLKMLNFQSNRFTVFPEVVCSMENLKYLTFSDNRIPDIPESIKKLSKLRYLTAINNKLKDIPKCVFEISDLIEINISRNQIRTIDYDSIPKDKSFILKGNPFKAKTLIHYERNREKYKNLDIQIIRKKKKNDIIENTICNTKGILYKINRMLLDNNIITKANTSPDKLFFDELNLSKMTASENELILKLKEKYFSHVSFLNYMGFNGSICQRHCYNDTGKHLFSSNEMTIENLKEKIKGNDPKICEEAAYALSDMKYEGRFSLYFDIFPLDSIHFNSFLVEELAEEKYIPAHTKMCDVIKTSDDTELARLCIHSLPVFEKDETCDFLISIVKEHSNKIIRNAAMYTLKTYQRDEIADLALNYIFNEPAPDYHEFYLLLSQNSSYYYSTFLEKLEQNCEKLVKNNKTPWYSYIKFFDINNDFERFISYLEGSKYLKQMAVKLIYWIWNCDNITCSFLKSAEKILPKMDVEKYDMESIQARHALDEVKKTKKKLGC